MQAMTIRNLAVLAATLLALLSACSKADPPPFDFERAKRLSGEKRQRFDLVFFNEMATWNEDSHRYGRNSGPGRKAEFERMAADGYFPAYAALRLVGFSPAEERDDAEALRMLLDEANKGDASAMCAVVAIPTKSALWGNEGARLEAARRMMITAAQRGQGHCLGSYGRAMLYGDIPGVPKEPEKGLTLLLESARQGYYRAAQSLFSFRAVKAYKNQFDFSDRKELQRALCWGRLAQQHTNWTRLDLFIEQLHNYAREQDRSDLLELAAGVDPRRVPITQQAVTPDDCIRIEKGE
jgi:hypothetical protein